MSRPLVAQPWFWLAFQAALLVVLFLCCDRYRLYPTDTDYYVDVALGTDWLSLENVLSSYRTFGYPLFLRAVLWVSPTLTALPLCHIAVRVLVVFAFHAGLRRLQVSGWLAMTTASAFLYTNTVFFGWPGYLPAYVLSDSLGESLLILTAALLLGVLGQPNSMLGWAGLTLSLFLTYQTRPALQFLVVLLPALGLLLMRMLAARPDWVRQRWRLGLGLSAASVLPFVAWCGLRLAVVGHFGLVSYTGHALIGIAGQFLSADLVPELPEDLRPLVRAVLTKQDQLAAGQVQTLFGGPWRPALDEHGRLRPGAVADHEMMVITQSQLFEYTVSELYEPDNILHDRLLLDVALAIIRARPRYYLSWVAQSSRVTLLRAFTYNFTFDLLMLPLVLLLGVWLVLFVVRWRRGSLPSPEVRSRRAADSILGLKVLVSLALGIALGNAAVIIFFGQPLERYMATGGTFLSAAAVVALVAVCGQIRALLPGGKAPAAP